MDINEAIRHRRSVRTFDGEPLRQEDARSVLDRANAAENPYGLPISWKLLDVEAMKLNTPVITGAVTFIAGKMKREKNAEAAFGYSFEKTVLFAETLGVGTTWIAGTMDRPAFESAVELGEDEVMPCISPLGYPAKKMTVRETLMRKGVKADWRMDFSELFFTGDFNTALTPESAGKLSEPLELVRLAPSAVNKQPWRVVLKDGRAHFYEKKSKGYVSSDGWDIQKIDMGIALCHFEEGARAAGFKTEFVIEDPQIPAPEDTEYIASYIYTA